MNMINGWNRTMITLLLLGCLIGSASGQEYKEYSKKSAGELYFKLMYDEDEFGYSTEQDGTTNKVVFDAICDKIGKPHLDFLDQIICKCLEVRWVIYVLPIRVSVDLAPEAPFEIR